MTEPELNERARAVALEFCDAWSLTTEEIGHLNELIIQFGRDVTAETRKEILTCDCGS